MNKNFGMKPYLIPLKQEDLTKENILLSLEQISPVFLDNKAKYEKNYTNYVNQHEIFNKTRRYEDDGEINNQLAMPNLWEIVEFKTGYSVGHPIEYDPKIKDLDGEISYLNNHFEKSNKSSCDVDVTTNIYVSGNGYYFIQPKQYLDIESDCPYDIFSIDPNTCGKVYSSYIGNNELFDFLVTDIEEDGNVVKTLWSVYTKDAYYLFETSPDGDDFVLVEEQARPIYKYLPLVEKYANKDRIGLCEIGLSLQNSIDKIASTELDNVEDLANELLIFRNCSLGRTPEEKRINLKNAKKNGAIEINDKNPDISADVKTLTQKLEHSDINSLIDLLKKELYSSCGVPLSTSDTSNGGNKTGALELGNGWENAFIRISKETKVMKKADKEILERVLFIEKSIANGVIKNLMPENIDIKYNINRSNNLIVKVQAYDLLIKNNVPPEIALNICELTSDPHSIGTIIKDNTENEMERKVKLLNQENTSISISGKI